MSALPRRTAPAGSPSVTSSAPPGATPAAAGGATPTLALPVALFVATLLGACASGEKRDCESGAWELLGERDGRAGLGFERVAERNERCSDYDIVVDAAAWTAGHERGIARYCERGNGFDLGQAGKDYSGNCPAALEGRFLASYVRGLGIRRDELQLRYDRLRRDVERAERARAALDADADTDDLDERIDELEEQLEETLGARREVNARHARWSRAL